MGNFFSQYEHSQHSCTPHINRTPHTNRTPHINRTPVPEYLWTAGEWIKGSIFPRQQLNCTSSDRSQITKSASSKRQVAQSFPLDSSKPSFLSLPPEIRNNIYCHLLISPDTYIRPFHTPTTNEEKIKSHHEARMKKCADGLVLLRTCKQIHDEAASVFYAANSFYVEAEKVMDVRVRPPEGTAKGVVDATQTLFDSGLRVYTQETGMVIFPAERYHVWCTRITIDMKIHIRGFEREGTTCQRSYKTDTEMYKEMGDLFARTFEGVRRRWEEKDSEWEGRMVASADPSSFKVIHFMLSFAEDEEDECKIKARLRKGWRG